MTTLCRQDGPQIRNLVVFTGNAHPDLAVSICAHADVLSVAPLLGEAIRRIHVGESVSSLFASM